MANSFLPNPCTPTAQDRQAKLTGRPYFINSSETIMNAAKPLSSQQAIFWILCLASLSVGIRNFEPGLTSDAPLYSTIARNISRSGEWFLLWGDVPEFMPFVDHPHLGFWLLACVFKVLPAQDWAARIPGNLFYLGFLFLFFRYVRRLSGERAAIWTVLLLWSWSRFSNFFSNVYLDPALLFFATAALIALDVSLKDSKPWYAVAGGVCLALAAMVKGLAVLGFIPALATILITFGYEQRADLRRLIKPLLLFVVCAVLVFGLYFWAVRSSRAPDFLNQYWSNQMTLRFAQQWNWWGVLHWRGWRGLLIDTYFLFPLALLAMAKWRKGLPVFLPVTLFLTFVFMYSSAGLSGTQYWLTILPWIAWLLGEGLFYRLKFNPSALVRVTSVFSLLAVAFSQYVPINVGRLKPPDEVASIRETLARTKYRNVVLLVQPHELHFLGASRFAWYADVEVRYLKNLEDLPSSSSPRSVVFLLAKGTAAIGLEKSRLTEVRQFSGSSLWAEFQNPN